MTKHVGKVLTVALNPTIDRGLEVPDFQVGGHQIGRRVFRRPAGKAVNVSRVLNALHVPSAITGFVGKAQQAYFEKQLELEHLSCQLFAIDGQTRENITIMDPTTSIETHIRERGFRVGPSDLARLRKKLSLLSREDMTVCFSGSLPEGVGDEELIELIQICQMQGAKVCLDSGGAALRACSPLKLHIIKPNFSELSEMLEVAIHGEDEILAAAERLRAVVAMALVSCGSEGGYLVTDDAIWRGKVTIDPASVNNTVGCGDALLGGFLAGGLGGRGVEDSYRYALAVATSAATSVAPGAIDREQIDRFCDMADIRRVQ